MLLFDRLNFIRHDSLRSDYVKIECYSNKLPSLLCVDDYLEIDWILQLDYLFELIASNRL